ncbi:MAG: DJ-1/PfpI family protein [Gammaproteobacteria bacterium]|nr:DJ-1/PfpI family protein [Gammaproteobacteria bacterium]
MNIGIYVYDAAEVLDFSGPFEVFSTASRLHTQNEINVFLVAETDRLVVARSGFTIKPNFTISDHPHLDLLLVPGGVHTEELTRKNVIAWIRAQAACAAGVASVCTGAFLLAEAGLLDGRTVTTHWEDVPALRNDYPALTVQEDVRWVEDGPITTSAGISAGIDMSLSIVEKLFGNDLAVKTARQMEYVWIQKVPG